MDLSEFCKGNVVTIDETATLRQAAMTMRDRDVGSLVVMAQGLGRPIGIVSDRDLVTAALAESADLAGHTVGSILADHLITVSTSQTWKDALKLMSERRVRRLLIVDDSLSIRGFVSMDDLIVKLADEAMTHAQNIEKLSRLIQIQVGTASRHRSHDFTQMA